MELQRVALLPPHPVCRDPTPGCFEESTEHDSTLVATVPKGVTRQLRQKMLGSANPIALSLPILDQIPEEAAVGGEAQGPAGPDVGGMDGGNNAEEANEEPSSDEEEPHQQSSSPLRASSEI